VGLHKRVKPLLDLAAVICKQIKTVPIETAVNVQVCGHEDETVPEWLVTRKNAAAEIDPETAEVDWSYGQTLDPYGVMRYLPDEYYSIGREYFARAPGRDVWVLFDDLPAKTVKALWNKHSSKLAFPAGLPFRRSAAKRQKVTRAGGCKGRHT
jgi:hypothetical protein